MEPSPALQAFIEQVAAEPALAAALAEWTSPGDFARAAATAARERGSEISAAEVEELLRARAQIWLQRHLL